MRRWNCLTGYPETEALLLLYILLLLVFSSLYVFFTSLALLSSSLSSIIRYFNTNLLFYVVLYMLITNFGYCISNFDNNFPSYDNCCNLGINNTILLYKTCLSFSKYLLSNVITIIIQHHQSLKNTFNHFFIKHLINNITTVLLINIVTQLLIYLRI
jgi:hypothetical protein